MMVQPSHTTWGWAENCRWYGKASKNVFVQLNQRLKELEEQETVMRRYISESTKNYNRALKALHTSSMEAFRTS